MRSTSRMGSIIKLAQVAREVSWQHNNGSIDCLYTYEDFVRRWKACDEKEGDPPTRVEHQNPAPPVLDTAFARAKISAPSSSTANNTTVEVGVEEVEGTDQAKSELSKLSLTELKASCKERFETTSGTKAELIERLLKPRKPEILITRLRHGQYVPKVPSCNAALMVALFLHDR